MPGGGLDAHAGCVWLAALFALGICLVGRVLYRLVHRLFQQWGIVDHVPRDMREFVDDLERTAGESFRADLYAAQCRAALVSLTGKVPADFDPTVLLACQVSAGLHRAVLVEAERQGLLPEGSFERVYGVSVEDAAGGPMVRGRAPTPPEAWRDERDVEAEPEPDAGSRSVPAAPPGNVHWIGGRQVPRRAAM